jgi:hypothetical protein
MLARPDSVLEYARLGDGVGARPRLELAQDRRDVMVNGSRRDEQPLCDLGVAETFGHQRQHFGLPR